MGNAVQSPTYARRTVRTGSSGQPIHPTIGYPVLLPTQSDVPEAPPHRRGLLGRDVCHHLDVSPLTDEFIALVR